MNRPTRLRNNGVIRGLVRETSLSMDDVIYPIFVVEGEGVKREIPSMKNQFHLSVDMLDEEVGVFKSKGIKSLLIFGTPGYKDHKASSAFDCDGIVQRAVRKIKEIDSEMLVITDVCLCQYKDDGHCCVYHKNIQIDRETTLEILRQVALSHALAGADMVAPSDMMDGRVGHIRKVLDDSGFEHVSIMSYSAKYASSFYGPFREAAHSVPSFGDRKMYQMDIGNSKEAMKEMALDVMEGADILMVKPAQLYLDIIKKAEERFDLPIAAYQVSGEYAMIYNAVEGGYLDRRAIYESLLAIKRSGASIVISYFAKELKALIELYG
ncbi:porphobilinogen synthase [Natranaerovirga pectinivora]|uniref:Delta-aminolevulinic acid dehydratase n=1 Tax=Natranaerovirga pectinivora TaxID=682400 RepID=A0A4R3ML23_9FIRM|nr:porphobilinogen synthase [Natranaerovirga pectinivora]TCT14252.1 porphobilinogen synthase [Natranaerovirga pectinivora]